MANNVQTVKTRVISYKSRVLREWGTEYTKPDTVYVFSNGRKFVSTDRTTSGIYKRP